MGRLDEKRFSWKDLLLCIMLCVIGLLICFIIWALSKKTYEQFMLQFSFAATISSIILSVLAIFMSISGETKTTIIREKIEKETEDMRKANMDLQALLSQLSQKVDNVMSETKEIKKNAYINQSKQDTTAFQTETTYQQKQ